MKYKKYSKYKDGGVAWLGEVPGDWNVYPARSIVNNRMDKNINTKDDRYLSLMANVGVIPYEDKGAVGNKKPDDLSKCKIVKKGNLVINSMNYSIGSYGMSEYDGICSPVYVVLDINKEITYPSYGLRLFENSAFQKYIASFGNGILAHRAAIGWDEIKGAYLPIPIFQEQQVIANFLDKATGKIDALISKQEKLGELIKEKRQAVISQAVTKGLNPNVLMKDSGVECLGNIPVHWEVNRLKYISSVNDNVLSDNTSGDLEINYIDIGSVTTGRIERYEDMMFKDAPSRAKRIIKDGDILVSTVRTYLKAIAPVTKEYQGYIASTGFAVVRPREKFCSCFAKYALLSNYFIDLVGSRSVGVSYPAINACDLIAFNLSLPPLEEQQTIADYLDDQTSRIDDLIEKSNKSIKLLKEKRTALISAAVTGKIDVREVA